MLAIGLAIAFGVSTSSLTMFAVAYVLSTRCDTRIPSPLRSPLVPYQPSDAGAVYCLGSCAPCKARSYTGSRRTDVITSLAIRPMILIRRISNNTSRLGWLDGVVALAIG